MCACRWWQCEPSSLLRPLLPPQNQPSPPPLPTPRTRHGDGGIPPRERRRVQREARKSARESGEVQLS